MNASRSGTYLLLVVLQMLHESCEWAEIKCRGRGKVSPITQVHPADWYSMIPLTRVYDKLFTNYRGGWGKRFGAAHIVINVTGNLC